MSLDETICVRLNYQGRVQGVGFRMTTANIAKPFSVTGYVKNLQNGSVELVATGSTTEVESFLKAVTAELGGYIKSTSQEQITAPQSYDDFRIAY